VETPDKNGCGSKIGMYGGVQQWITYLPKSKNTLICPNRLKQQDHNLFEFHDEQVHLGMKTA
jgi:hypothetical protein